MDLIEDLGTDVAVALLVEGKHLEKIEARDAMNLIGKIRKSLDPHCGCDSSSQTSEVPRIASA